MNGKPSGSSISNLVNLSLADWHHRFQQQAEWTKPARDQLLSKLDLTEVNTALEVGCGTGAIISEIQISIQCKIVGLDINLKSLEFAQPRLPGAKLINGDGTKLPFSNASFDLTFCHYFLLWVADPRAALAEMRRVTKPGGTMLAFGEPDYGGALAYPPDLEKIYLTQAQELQEENTDIHIGRKLRHLFVSAGMENVEVGIIGGQWTKTDPDISSEIQLIRSTSPPGGQMNSLAQDQSIPDAIFFVPTFYAFGQVPGF